jgi:hypothetical protein
MPCTQITCSFRVYEIILEVTAADIAAVQKAEGLATAQEAKDSIMRFVSEDPKFQKTDGTKCDAGCICIPNVPDDDDGKEGTEEEELKKAMKNGKKTKWIHYSKDYRGIDVGTGAQVKIDVKYKVRSILIEGQCMPDPKKKG